MAVRTCRHCGGVILVTKTKRTMLLACTVCKRTEQKVFTSKGG